MTETWLSQDAHDRLLHELESLSTDGRARISAEIQVARAHGDLRENAEYHAAKDEQGHMEGRIRQLEQLLRNAKIGTPKDTNQVRQGLIVVLKIEGDTETYLLGSREDEHPEHEVLSADSPIGTAILGQPAGTTVSVEAPSGSFDVTVTEIKAP